MIPLGVQLSVGGSSVLKIVEAARDFEEAGFESVWVGSHLIDHYDAARAVPDCFVTLSAIAAATKAITFGSLAVPALQFHPSVLAHIAGTLDEFSNGRFSLGIGAGGTRAEYKALGMEFPRKAARVDRLGETVRTLMALRQGGPVDADIGGVALRDAWCKPSLNRTRLVIAALGQRTAALAGALADEVNTIDYASQFDAERIIQHATEAAEREKRAVTVSIMVPAPSELEIGGGPHPEAGPGRATALGAHRLVYRIVPPYPSPDDVLARARAAA